MTSPKYEWQNDYYAALLELNPNRLPMRIEKSEATIAARRLALSPPLSSIQNHCRKGHLL